MKKNVIVMLVLACLPLWVVAQNTNDDLYFIPKKKVEKKKEVVEIKSVETAGNETTGTPVVVKDVNGNVRDVDEYNRRYTSRDNYFKMENDTLYIEEKPYDERGEWVNGFDGTQSDYEYAMRIIRFRNPYYAIPVSSPLYWDIVYGLPSWEWNVFNDGFYAYAFPTFSNSLWWNWRWSWNWGWGSSWHYGWHRSYWGFDAYWYRPHWHYGYCHPYHHHHYHHGWAGTGGYWGKNHGWNGSTATRPGIHAGRYKNNYQNRYASAGTSNRKVATGANRNSRDRYVNGVRQNNTRNDRTNRVSSGRVVTAKDATGASSVRPQRSATRNRSNGNVTQRNNNGRNNTYTRPAEGQRSSYTRQSSTRSTSSYQRSSGAAERGAYRSSSSAARSSESRSSYDKSSSSSSSRSSYSSGSSSRSSSGGGSSRSGGGSRSAGRR